MPTSQGRPAETEGEGSSSRRSPRTTRRRRRAAPPACRTTSLSPSPEARTFLPARALIELDDERDGGLLVLNLHPRKLTSALPICRECPSFRYFMLNAGFTIKQRRLLLEPRAISFGIYTLSNLSRWAQFPRIIATLLKTNCSVRSESLLLRASLL